MRDRPIFLVERDFTRLLGRFERIYERYGVLIHAYVLMTNHYHLLLETPRGNLSAALHDLNTAYTNYFNRRHDRVGHLFQGRYRSILVDKDNYLLELSRYIHLNPVRARMVKRPDAYRWSSYSSYLSFGIFAEMASEGGRYWGRWTATWPKDSANIVSLLRRD